ncbi:hypothetical protein FB008_12250 [Sinorhizobium medicae]|nr:hypothetical protein [Sinorhizobium medicae]MDX0846458.1 hypothetical protein [Sinorhizobium medicae]TWA46660.1 hypothetical protein FB008_12250 [Sinorhizobium medicae]
MEAFHVSDYRLKKLSACRQSDSHRYDHTCRLEDRLMAQMRELEQQHESRDRKTYLPPSSASSGSSAFASHAGANEPQSRFLRHSPACLALRNLSGAFDGIVILLRELATAFSWSGTAIIGIDYALKAGGAPDNRFAICSQVFGAEGSGLVFVVFNAF